MYVGDLGNNGDPDELRRMFSRYGSVQDVWVAHKPPGFAFVFYRTVREAREAVKGADGRMVCGVRVRVRMGTEMNQSEAQYQGRSFEREYDSPPRERSRPGSSYQGRGHQQSQSHGPRHSDRSSRNYEEHSPPRPSPPRSSWSGRGSRRSIPHSHPSSMGHSFSSRSHAEDLYSPPLPSSSHSKYGGHKKNYEASSHFSPNDRYSSREGGSRITSRPRYTSPDRLPRFSPQADTAYHGNRRGNNRFERHEVQQYDYKDKPQRSRHKEHVYPKIPSHRHHRSRSPHSFSPPPAPARHDRRHGNKGGWGYGNHSPPLQPPSRRPHYDDHRGYRERASHDEQFESRSFSSDRPDRGSRKDYIFDGGRSDNSSRYSSKNNEHSYKSADREVKYRGHQRYPSSEHYSGQAEFHDEPYIRQERVEYVEHNRSDRGSSLEGVGVDDDFSDVVIVERDPHDLRRKLLSEGDNEREVREAVSSERG